MPQLFISYRREDTSHFARLLRDKLQLRFGRGSVFFDVDSIPHGVAFPEYIKGYIEKTDAFIAVIGPKWSSVKHTNGPKAGTRRIEDTEDHLRIEIETAISNGITVFPVLVSGAAMPTKEELPPSLGKLNELNAIEMLESAFQYSMDSLFQDLEDKIKIPYSTARDTAINSLKYKINFDGEFNSDVCKIAVEMLKESGDTEGQKLLVRIKSFTSGQLDELSFVGWLKTEKKRQEKEKAKRKLQEEQQRQAQEEAERDRKAQEEAERKKKFREEIKRKQQEEKKQQDRDLAARELQAELAELKLQAKRERQAREEAERKLQEEREQKDRELAAIKLQAEQELQARVEAQNLVLWEQSGFPRKWVDEQRGQWSHSDWIALLTKLKRTKFWPMDSNSIGKLLEEQKLQAEKENREQEEAARKLQEAAERKRDREGATRRLLAKREQMARDDAESKLQAERKRQEESNRAAEAARIKAEAEATSARLESERKRQEDARRAAEAEAARIKATEDELAKTHSPIKIVALVDGNMVSAKVVYGDNTWESPITLNLQKGGDFHFRISYEDTSGIAFFGDLLVTANWNGERTEYVNLLDAKRKQQAEMEAAALRKQEEAAEVERLRLEKWVSQQSGVSAEEHFLKGHWEFAAMEYEKLLDHGHSLADYGPKLVTCLLNAHENLLDTDATRIKALLQSMEEAGLVAIIEPLRLQFKAKQASTSKKWWPF